MTLQQFFDEAAGLWAIERFDRQAEHLLGQDFGFILVEAVLLDQFEDEFPLLVGTNPVITGLIVTGYSTGCSPFPLPGDSVVSC